MIFIISCVLISFVVSKLFLPLIFKKVNKQMEGVMEEQFKILAEAERIKQEIQFAEGSTNDPYLASQVNRLTLRLLKITSRYSNTLSGIDSEIKALLKKTHKLIVRLLRIIQRKISRWFALRYFRHKIQFELLWIWVWSVRCTTIESGFMVTAIPFHKSSNSSKIKPWKIIKEKLKRLSKTWMPSLWMPGIASHTLM